MRRAAALVLGLLYLLQAAWLLEGGADLLFPRTTIVQPGSTACCTNGCGCPEEAKQRKSCCCFPDKDMAAEAPVEVPVSALEEARCHGSPETILELIEDPALPVAELILPAAPAEVDVDPVVQRPPLPLPDRSVEKVPI